jgi:hypothetical protein
MLCLVGLSEDEERGLCGGSGRERVALAVLDPAIAIGCTPPLCLNGSHSLMSQRCSECP